MSTPDPVPADSATPTPLLIPTPNTPDPAAATLGTVVAEIRALRSELRTYTVLRIYGVSCGKQLSLEQRQKIHQLMAELTGELAEHGDPG